jgi:hypothetical protein
MIIAREDKIPRAIICLRFFLIYLKPLPFMAIRRLYARPPHKIIAPTKNITHAEVGIILSSFRE